MNEKREINMPKQIVLGIALAALVCVPMVYLYAKENSRATEVISTDNEAVGVICSERVVKVTLEGHDFYATSKWCVHSPECKKCQERRRRNISTRTPGSWEPKEGSMERPQSRDGR